MSRFLDVSISEECLRQAAAGDRDAQRVLYAEVAGPLFALVRQLVPQRVAAEDVFQDCMVCLLRQLSSFRAEAPFGAWVRQIAVRQCLMHHRSPWQRVRRTLESLLDSGEEHAQVGTASESPEDAIDLDRALARLPDVSRSVVWLYDVEGLDHAEIAALFGRSVSFSKSQLSRAHALLRAQLSTEPVPPLAPAAAQGQVR